MKHFVTGGAGHIGSHLVDRLISDGHEVTVYDNLSTGRHEDVNPQAQTMFGDIRNLELLTRAMQSQDVVWHLAANGDIPLSVRDTNYDLQVNTIGTKNVLDAMRTNQVPKILFSSTAAVYGDGAANRRPLAETYGPLLPISLYAASKLAGEGLISAYCHLFGIEAWIFRFANVVSNRMNHGVCFDLIEKLKKNPKELEIWSNGEGEKAFFLTDDCIQGMLTVFQTERVETCSITNLGTPDFTKISDVADIVIEEMGLDKNKVFKKFTGGERGFLGDVPIVRYNIDRAESMGYRPSHTSTKAVRIAVRRLLGVE